MTPAYTLICAYFVALLLGVWAIVGTLAYLSRLCLQDLALSREFIALQRPSRAKKEEQP
jgi:hypothetical protein